MVVLHVLTHGVDFADVVILVNEKQGICRMDKESVRLFFCKDVEVFEDFLGVGFTSAVHVPASEIHFEFAGVVFQGFWCVAFWVECDADEFDLRAKYVLLFKFVLDLDHVDGGSRADVWAIEIDEFDEFDIGPK